MSTNLKSLTFLDKNQNYSFNGTWHRRVGSFTSRITTLIDKIFNFDKNFIKKPIEFSKKNESKEVFGNRTSMFNERLYKAIFV